MIMVDPPSGHLYGFPKEYPEEMLADDITPEDIAAWFIKQGYPEKDIELAMKYSRRWGTPNE